MVKEIQLRKILAFKIMISITLTQTWHILICKKEINWSIKINLLSDIKFRKLSLKPENN